MITFYHSFCIQAIDLRIERRIWKPVDINITLLIEIMRVCYCGYTTHNMNRAINVEN